MIHSNQDLYRIVEKLARRLEETGEIGEAGALRDAMSISSVPGEVLEEVRAALQRIRRTTPYGSPDVRADVEDAIRYVTAVLG